MTLSELISKFIILYLSLSVSLGITVIFWLTSLGAGSLASTSHIVEALRRRRSEVSGLYKITKLLSHSAADLPTRRALYNIMHPSKNHENHHPLEEFAEQAGLLNAQPFMQKIQLAQRHSDIEKIVKEYKHKSRKFRFSSFISKVLRDFWQPQLLTLADMTGRGSALGLVFALVVGPDLYKPNNMMSIYSAIGGVIGIMIYNHTVLALFENTQAVVYKQKLHLLAKYRTMIIILGPAVGASIILALINVAHFIKYI